MSVFYVLSAFGDIRNIKGRDVKIGSVDIGTDELSIYASVSGDSDTWLRLVTFADREANKVKARRIITTIVDAMAAGEKSVDIDWSVFE